MTFPLDHSTTLRPREQRSKHQALWVCDSGGKRTAEGFPLGSASEQVTTDMVEDVVAGASTKVDVILG